MKKMVVFNMRTAGFLMLRGHQLRKIDKSSKNPDKNVFIFDETEDLRKSIGEFDNFMEINKDYLLR